MFAFLESFVGAGTLGVWLWGLNVEDPRSEQGVMLLRPVSTGFSWSWGLAPGLSARRLTVMVDVQIIGGKAGVVEEGLDVLHGGALVALVMLTLHFQWP